MNYVYLAINETGTILKHLVLKEHREYYEARTLESSNRVTIPKVWRDAAVFKEYQGAVDYLIDVFEIKKNEALKQLKDTQEKLDYLMAERDSLQLQIA